MLKRCAIVQFGFSSVPVLAVLSLSASGCGKNNFQHGDAIAAMEKSWNTSGHYHVLPLGEVRIVRSDANVSKRQATVDDMHAYSVLERQRDIVISSNIDLTAGNRFSWGDFFEMSQNSVVRKINVSITRTSDGKLACPEFMQKGLGASGVICVDLGHGAVEEVVRSQEFQVGTRKCLLIMGKHHWKWSDAGRRIQEAKGKVAVEEMKFMAIMEYEEFAKEWQLGMVEYAPRTGSFGKRREFDNVLRQARLHDFTDQ